MPHPRRTRALTLIELIILIAVTATLAATLLPALLSARARARGMHCISSLNQVQLGMHLYFNTCQYLPVDSYVSPLGERFGESQTAHLWSGPFGVKRGLGLMVPSILEEPAVLFEGESNWARFVGPAGWRRPDGGENWLNPAQNVISSYVYRQNFGRRVLREEAGESTALVTEYTLLNSGRYNHGGRRAHILFADGHVSWHPVDGPEPPLLKWDYLTLETVDPGTGASGWETGMDPLK